MTDSQRIRGITAALVAVHGANTFGENTSRINVDGVEAFQANAERMGEGLWEVRIMPSITGSSVTSFRVNALGGGAYGISDDTGVHTYHSGTGTAVIGNQPYQLTVTKTPTGNYNVQFMPGISFGTKAELAVAAAKFIDLGPNFRWQTFDAPGLPSRQMVTLNTSQGPVPARVTRVGKGFRIDILSPKGLLSTPFYLFSNVTHPTAAGGSSGWTLVAFSDETSLHVKKAANTDGYVIDTTGLGNAQFYTSTGVSYPVVVAGTLAHEILQRAAAGQILPPAEQEFIRLHQKAFIFNSHDGFLREREYPLPLSCPGGKHKKHHRKH